MVNDGYQIDIYRIDTKESKKLKDATFPKKV